MSKMELVNKISGETKEIFNITSIKQDQWDISITLKDYIWDNGEEVSSLYFDAKIWSIFTVS